MSITLVDSSLRDGMHSVAHQLSPEQVGGVARTLDGAGVPVVEVAHGDGLGGSSIQYGISRAPDEALVAAAVEAVDAARIAVLLLPGIGTLRQLRGAQRIGASVARVATHCTEADIAQQHLSWARGAGMRAIGFLMMSHMLEPGALAAQALLMESYGAEVVYVVDSAGALVPRGVTARVQALREALRPETAVGFHAHNNIGCGVGNALAAAEAGATWLDGSLRGLGAGAGNAQLEALAIALERTGHPTGVDLLALMDAADRLAVERVAPDPVIDRAALSLGMAGVYSSFMLHAERAARKFGVDAREVLLEVGRRRIVGGQEDRIIEIAAELAASPPRR